MDTILEMAHITKLYPGVRALDDVAFSVKKGEVHALMGENGAGKSTLIKVLSGTHRADKGEVFLEGKKVEINSPNDALALGISMIYQELSPIPELTIMENIFTGVRFPRKGKGVVNWKEAYARCQKLFEDLKLGYNPRTKMRMLSIADAQMIEIVKAISFNSKIIIMDEPSSALTEQEVQKLFDFIRALKEKGITVIIITHKLDEVFTIADTVTVLRDGAYIGTRPVCDITRGEMITMMVGRDVKDVYFKPPYEAGGTILKVEHLAGSRRKNADVSFEVRRGEILGVSGIVGAGRTEAMRCIFGLDQARAGRILYKGEEVRIKTPRDAIRKGIMMITEDRKADGLVLCQSIFDNMLLPSTFRNSWHLLDLLAAHRVPAQAQQPANVRLRMGAQLAVTSAALEHDGKRAAGV